MTATSDHPRTRDPEALIEAIDAAIMRGDSDRATTLMHTLAEVTGDPTPNVYLDFSLTLERVIDGVPIPDHELGRRSQRIDSVVEELAVRLAQREARVDPVGAVRAIGIVVRYQAEDHTPESMLRALETLAHTDELAARAGDDLDRVAYDAARDDTVARIAGRIAADGHGHFTTALVTTAATLGVLEVPIEAAATLIDGVTDPGTDGPVIDALTDRLAALPPADRAPLVNRLDDVVSRLGAEFHSTSVRLGQLRYDTVIGRAERNSPAATERGLDRR